MLTPSRRNHCELKKKLWSLIFALQLISLNLTQPPPPQSFLVDLKTIHPMDCMEIWPKKHKNQNKTPKTIAPNHQKCHKKKWLHCGSCSPFQSGLFLWKAVALLAIWSAHCGNVQRTTPRHDDWWTSNSSSDSIRRSLEKKNEAFCSASLQKVSRNNPWTCVTSSRISYFHFNWSFLSWIFWIHYQSWSV